MADPAEIDPDGIARREFTTTFRGFDQVEVRAFLTSTSMQLRQVLDREADLVSRLEQAEQRAAQADTIDEHRLAELLGEETTRIFEAAREAATEIRGKAEAKTAQLVREAQDDANRMTSEAAEVLRLRTSEAETAAAALRADAESDRDRMLADASTEVDAMRVQAAADAERMRSEAQAVLDQAEIDAAAAVEAGRQEGRDMVAEAQVVRERILKDLARRRRAGKAQLEQLRAARERLLDAYALVRRTLDEATNELTVAVPEAKLAADAAGRRVEVDDDELSVEAIEAELDAGRVAGVPLLDTGEHPVTRLSVVPDTDEPAGDAPAEGVEEIIEQVIEESVEVTTESVEPDTVADDEPEAAAPADEIDAGDSDEADEAGEVEDLFARIRSEVPEPVAVADDDAVEVGTISFDPEPEDQAEAGAEIGPDDEDHDETALERRDRYLADLEIDLGRVLKRQLADDENDKLDLIRRRPAKAKATELLPSLEEHRALFVDAVTDTLVLAAASGNEFASSLVDPDHDADDVIDLDVDLDDIATELVDTLLVPIRERVAELVADSEGDDAIDGVRACYRRGKGTVSEVASLFVHTAFNRGVFDAVPEGTLVRWVVDPGAGPCPDGEDDALEGPISKGTPFPTGHLHPPAHPGCRCLLVPGVL